MCASTIPAQNKSEEKKETEIGSLAEWLNFFAQNLWNTAEKIKND